MCYLYVSQNDDWKYESKYKAGFTTDYRRRIIDSHEQHSHLSTYLYLFELNIDHSYGLPKSLYEVDKIIFVIGKSKENISILEKRYSIKLPFLISISGYLVQHNGSTEFILEDGLEILLNIIRNEFPLLGIRIVKEYTKQEIDDINKKIMEKYKKLQDNINLRILNDVAGLLNSLDNVKLSNEIEELIPYDFQQEVLDIAVEYYKTNDKGKLIWACGLGKTLMSLFICNKLQCKNILIGVPSKYLSMQFINSIVKLFDKECILGVNSDIGSTTNENKIRIFMESDLKYKIIVTTYDSCYKILKISEQLKFIFDMKIGDEAHHLVCCKKEDKKTYDKFHLILSKKTLFMTATEKIIKDNDDKIVYSMDDVSTFGEMINTKSIKWAIDNEKITDFIVAILMNTEQDIEYIINSTISYIKDIDNPNISIGDIRRNLYENIELYISAYMLLNVMINQPDKYIEHALIYVNNTKNADKVKNYLNSLIRYFNANDIYIDALHSKNADKKFKEEIIKFKNSKMGIIVCVYMFGEGFDIPELDAVVIAENMEAEIRIVQSVLRPNRLNKNKPKKIAHIIIPYLGTLSFTDENNSFSKVRSVIRRLNSKNMKVIEKVKVYDIKPQQNEIYNELLNTVRNNNVLIENVVGLDILKLCLINSNDIDNDLSFLQNEYNLVQKENKLKNIQTIKEYNDHMSNNCHYIDNPEKHFKPIWKGWYDFLDIDTSIYPDTKQVWIELCKSIKIISIDDYFNKCNYIKNLPLYPNDLYKNQNFSNILHELDLMNYDYY